MVWKPGCESPNPNGRPVGTQNKRTQLAKLFEPHAPALINKCVEMALAGDVTALRIAIERIVPRSKDEPVPFVLPEEINATTIKSIFENVLRSLGNGEISPEEAKNLVTVLKDTREYIAFE